jgi:hypothetical protein
VWDGFYISARGLCQEHSLEREIANILEMKAGRGQFFDHWARRSIMAMHRRLVANEQSEV